MMTSKILSVCSMVSVLCLGYIVLNNNNLSENKISDLEYEIITLRSNLDLLVDRSDSQQEQISLLSLVELKGPAADLEQQINSKPGDYSQRGTHTFSSEAPLYSQDDTTMLELTKLGMEDMIPDDYIQLEFDNSSKLTTSEYVELDDLDNDVEIQDTLLQCNPEQCMLTASYSVESKMFLGASIHQGLKNLGYDFPNGYKVLFPDQNRLEFIF